MIFANSPEAKGRIERSFRTIQDRLVPELRQAGATTMSEANKYLADEFLAKYWNQQKIVAPRDTISAYEPLDPWLKLEEIFCIIEERKIASDQTVSYQGQRYVISGIAGSLAGYMASFKTNIKGELNVYVMEQKVEIEPTTTRLFNKEDTISFKIDDRRLYTGMYRLASNLNGAVWKSKITGKPIKLPKTKRKKAS